MAWTKIPTYSHPQIFSNSSHFSFSLRNCIKKLTKQSVKQAVKILKKYIRLSSGLQDCTSSIKCIFFPIYILTTKYTLQLSAQVE